MKKGNMGMGKSVSLQNRKVGSKATTAALWSIAMYLVWTLATYMLEGRINLLQQPTIAGRYTYVLIANVLIGTIGAIWVVRSVLSSQLVRLTQIGFRSFGRTVLTIVIAVVIGVVYLFLMRPAALPSLVIINGYAQVLTVSIAEIVVCWVLVGTSFELLAKSRGKFLSLLVGTLAATILFSVYHVGHSAPFNQIHMMLILLMPGVLTSLFYFISREIYATVVFHNFQGTFGVLSNLENPEILNRPLYPLYFLVLLAIVTLIGSDMFLARRTSREG
jgi:hypothetical protein